MLQASQEYREAVVGSPRRTEPRVLVDLTDPDMVYGGVQASSVAPWGAPEQVVDKELDPPKRYGTLEVDRWRLDGSVSIFPEDLQVPESMGWTSGVLCGADGMFEVPPWIQINFSGVSSTLAVMVLFSEDPLDGMAADFTVEVYVRGALFQAHRFTGNKNSRVIITGALYEPTAIRVTCTRWSLPYRRMRVVEISPGVLEKWGGRMLAGLQCEQQAEFSCLSLPYGSASVSFDNKDRRYDPRNKAGLFLLIRERQHIDISIGVRLPNGSYEWKQVGRYYMAANGWRSSQNDLTMTWRLVDIVGLLSDRPFVPPETLPTTLGGWLKAIVSQLGASFINWWTADPAYINKPVVAYDRKDVTDKSCGDMIRWVCQATGTWPRAEAGTGRLCAQPLWDQGGKVTLANLERYPGISANQTLSRLAFTLQVQEPVLDPDTGEPETDPDTGEPVMVQTQEEYVIDFPGSPNGLSVAVRNPFFHTQEQAREAAQLIVAMYGGNILETTGRGDPSSEIGDVDTIWLDESNAASARRMMQSFEFQGGVLRGCRSKLLQADGGQLLTSGVLLTASGTWTPPEGVTDVTVILCSGGQGGGHGERGTIGMVQLTPDSEPVEWQFGMYISDANRQLLPAQFGARGKAGAGGRVWSGGLTVTPGQPIPVHIGAGGVNGNLGGDTTFGSLTSANGQVYPNGYTDILDLKTYGRTGVPAPLPGSGDGGAGGAGGAPDNGRFFRYGDNQYGWSIHWIYGSQPAGPGEPGAPGGSGFVLIRWRR